MKIHYSPYFDGTPYINFTFRENLLLDEVFIGNSGLLRELELRNGVPEQILPLEERQAVYYKAVKKIVGSNPDCFIYKSFQTDEYGTTAELLQWRDELVLAGWTTDIKGVSEKLDCLAAIEMEADSLLMNYRGESDRWYKIMHIQGPLLSATDELIVHYPENHLPSFIAAFIDKLRKHGISCCLEVPSLPIAPKGSNLFLAQQALLEEKHTQELSVNGNDESLYIIHFDHHRDALEWVAANKVSAETVFINSDNRVFDAVQELFDQPLSGHRLPDANPEIVQLFKLGCSLFVRPLQVYNLISYLQTSLHPLPSTLRRDLLRVVISEGGIANSRWQEVIDSYKHQDEIDSEKLNILLPLEADTDIINLERLRKFVRELRSWSLQQMVLNANAVDNTKALQMEQLASLKRYCNAFLILLENQNETAISAQKLSSWILSIYRPANYTGAVPQHDSRFVVDSPAAMADCSDEIVWIDCTNGMAKATQYQFLSDEEFILLKEMGIQVWSSREQVKAQLYSHRYAMLKCRRKCVLVASSKHNNEHLAAHPLLIQLNAQLNGLKKIIKVNPAPDAESMHLRKTDLPPVPNEIDLGAENLFTMREKESYSSLSDLILNPLDYVFNYQARLKDSGLTQLNDEKRTMGNVAHLFIELLVRDASNNLERMHELLQNDFINRFNDAVLQKGTILLLTENKILLNRFSLMLEKSVSNLLNIIRENNLLVEGCEVIHECRLQDKFLLESRIDMLLKTEAGLPVIFDLKWTGSKTFYHNMLIKNRALQLEVYKQVLKTALPCIDNPVVAYFDLARGILLTASNFTGEFVRVIGPENTDDIFCQAMNSYDFRWKQLNAGIIEVAEQMELDTIPYHQHCATENLYMLEKEYKKDKLKAAHGFSNYKTLKGGLQ